jgi:hypothetical protein
MISLDRGDEPDDLIRERSLQLACAKLYGRPKTSKEFKGYDTSGVRERLLSSQVFRCAYCEISIDDAGYPIEHFRPKTRADNVDWSVVQEPPSDHGEFFKWFDRWLADDRERLSWAQDHDRYWWLAWSWENLFYSCSACNTAYKGTKFPLEPGSSRLDEMAQPPASEGALLIDPSTVDPLDHIRFAPDRSDGWGPIPLTDQGRWTIAVLSLHKRQGLRTHWKRCANQIKHDPDFTAALDAISQRKDDAVPAPWSRALARLLHANSDFLALRWCVFNHYVPESDRQALGLSLPRPGRRASRAPKPLFEARPELDTFTEAAQIRVRAMGGRATTAEAVKTLIVDLCSEVPMDVATLANVLRREPGTVREYLVGLTGGPTSPLVYDPATSTYRLR